jgi:hypothetical protein
MQEGTNTFIVIKTVSIRYCESIVFTVFEPF